MGPSCSRLSDEVFVRIFLISNVLIILIISNLSVYTLIGVSINGASIFRVFAALIIFVVGLVYIGLEAIPSISPPENMNPEGISIGINDEDIV